MLLPDDGVHELRQLEDLQKGGVLRQGQASHTPQKNGDKTKKKEEFK